MKKTLVLISALLLLISCSPREKSPAAPIGKMSHAQIDSVLMVNAKMNYSISDRMRLYSEMFLGTPYSWNATGDGPYALLEKYPLVNFDSTNCMVYTEHVLALSISDSWDNFFNNLQQIRYKDGIIGMRTRNHYTMADWLPENRWLLEDVARKVGGDYTRSITRTISHENFFTRKGIRDLRYVKLDRMITVEYIPMRDLDKVKANFRNGDIVAMLFANRDDIFSAHMLMLYEKDGELYFREASNSINTTFETAFDNWLESKKENTRYAGLAVMRVRDEYNKPNAVVLP
ncbi:MAG: DUF1460 domain-containing protein, partial [Candidatus Marinimicrobia bacterium]|nr:DUF1460 domain-containing protein [Candidatus Neomarinimicrobiota bacterium]